MAAEPTRGELEHKSINWREMSPEQRAEFGQRLHELVGAFDDWEAQEQPPRFNVQWLRANGHGELVDWTNQTLPRKMLGLFLCAPDYVREVILPKGPGAVKERGTLSAFRAQTEGAHLLWQQSKKDPAGEAAEQFTSDTMQRLGYEELVDYLNRGGEIEQWMRETSPAVQADFALTDWERYTPDRAEADFEQHTEAWRDGAGHAHNGQTVESYIRAHAPLLHRFLESTGNLARLHRYEHTYKRAQQEAGREAYYTGARTYVQARVLYEALREKNKPTFEHFMELRFSKIDAQLYAQDTELQARVDSELQWKVPLLISVSNELGRLISEHGREKVTNQLAEIDPKLLYIIQRDFGSVEEIIAYVDRGTVRVKKTFPPDSAIQLSVPLYLDLARAHVEWSLSWSRQPFTSVWLQQHGYYKLVDWVNKYGVTKALQGMPPSVQQDLQLKKNWRRHTPENAQADLAALWQQWRAQSKSDRPRFQNFVRQRDSGLFHWLHRHGTLQAMLTELEQK